MRCRLGQLVDVRGPGKQSYLLSETPTHFLLHLRLTPHADGHARNHVDAEPTHQIPKETVAGDGR